MRKNIHVIVLGIASLLSVSAFSVLASYDQLKLSAFGPTARIYFMGLKNGFTVSSLILLISLISCLFLKNYLLTVYASAKYIYKHLSTAKKNLVVLILCILFSFASHAGNIMNGYFNMDDFQIAGINRVSSFGQSLLVPHGNDHTMPLFMAEMRAGDALFGQNPVPYNTFVFILFALTPFFTYLLFQRIGIGTKSFLAFLIIFSGATSWADMLSGFNIMSTYSQIILYFAVALWSYTAWFQTREKKYLPLFTLSTLFSITIDLPGIWTLPTIFLFMIYLYTVTRNKISIPEFIKINRDALLSFISVCIGFGVFFYVTFHIIQPDTFLSAVKTTGDGIASVENRDANWRPLPLAENFLYFFSSGVSISLFAPNIVKILTHPAMREHVKNLWPIFEILVLIGNGFLFWFVYKHSKTRGRKLLIFLFRALFITISMVIIARPNHEAIPDFDYRYAGAAFYFYCFFLALSSSLLLQNKKDEALKIIIPIVLILFSAQQAFGFYAVRLKEEAKIRETVLVRLNNTLLIELDKLTAKNGSLVIPSLSGVNIFDQIPGFSIVDYSLFFNKKFPITFIQNNAVLQLNNLKPVTSLRASTSPAFKQALKESSVVRSYYASSGLMVYKTINAKDVPLKSTIKKASFDPEKKHIVRFALSTTNTNGNIEITFSFKNDFGVSGPLGKIKIDDYTPFTVIDTKRVYAMETDLLQLYPYALSNKISDVQITVPDSKEATLFGVQLL